MLYYGAVDREHDRCVKALHGQPFVFDVLEMTGCPYIDIGRSICATAAMDNPEIGGVLFIDHDMVFEVSEAAKVIESAEACQGVAGAAYSMRRPGRIIGAIDGTKLEAGKKVVFFEGGESLPANYLGMGLTAIHRSVFERLVAASEDRHSLQQATLRSLQTLLEGPLATHAGGVAAEALDLLGSLAKELRWKDLPRLSTGISEAACVPFFSLLQLPSSANPKTEGNYYGEDISFCIRNHDHALPVRLDTRARAYHKGTYCFGIEDVGMQVPYFDRLEVLDTGAREPTMAPALFSPDPSVRAALAAAYPDGKLPAQPLPEPPLDMPSSFDPIAAVTNGGAHP